jgi:hypothetical protein
MPERNEGEAPALVVRAGRDNALGEALERLAPGRRLDRPDSPELHVTALRRLPSLSAQYAAFPETLDHRLQDALVSRGISQLYTH